MVAKKATRMEATTKTNITVSRRKMGVLLVSMALGFEPSTAIALPPSNTTNQAFARPLRSRGFLRIATGVDY